MSRLVVLVDLVLVELGTQQIWSLFLCVRRFEGKGFSSSFILSLNQEGILWGVMGLQHHPVEEIQRKSDCLISWWKSFESESSFWNTFQTFLTFSGRLRAALRRDHSLSGFLWWWCRLRHRTQTWRSLCLWRRSCGSRLLWCLGACSGPRTGVWCSYQHPRKC